MKRLVRVTLATAAFLAFADVAPAFATTKVDDDRAQCPDAQFTSISAAVAAAAPGESIEVCAGVYNESVVVDKRLSLKGWTQKLDGGDCLDRSRGVDPSRDTLVQGGSMGPGFWVQANEVEITNFTVQLAVNPGNGVGIYLSNAFSKYRIKENLVQGNVFGVYLNSNGVEESQVEVNCVRDNNQPGSASGNGVYSDQGVRNATVKDNTFTGHTNASVIFVGRPGTQSHLQIEANESLADAPYIFANVTQSTVKSNVSRGSSGSGIFFGGGSSDAFVEANIIENCAFTGINLRFLPVFYDVLTPNTRMTVKGNVVRGCGDAGIRFRDGTNSSVMEANRVALNGFSPDTDPFAGHGLGLEAALDNVVKGNESTENRSDGLRADVLAIGNHIEGNKMLRNGVFDCRDDSAGLGTAGTANFWKDNVGRTENRPGLCKRP